MHHLIILLLPIWLFGLFAGAGAFLEFCTDGLGRWWAFPLWMVGMLTVFVPAFFGGSLALSISRSVCDPMITPTLILAAIIIAMFAYPAARALDRWVQRIEMGVFARRRREMHDQAVATPRVNMVPL